MTESAVKAVKRSRTRFTAADIVAIREELATGAVTAADLAVRYRVHRDTIANIAVGKSWKTAGGPRQPRHTGPRSNTGFWGVTANGAGNRFTVHVTKEGQSRTFGWFKDVEEAARACDHVARALGSSPKKLNFPDEGSVTR